MKVMVINGSPSGEEGNTADIVSYIIKGMEEAGATVELYYTNYLYIEPCKGCLNCWFKTVGKCVIHDDMEDMYEKLKQINILLFAVPVYIPLPGEMQNFINRLCPIAEPLLEFKGGRTRIKLHDSYTLSKIAALVIGGWFERENLEIVVKILEELTMKMSIQFVEPMLRPHASLVNDSTERAKDVIDALHLAGIQLIKNGRAKNDILNRISQPLITEGEYRDRLNQAYIKAKNSEGNNS